MKVLCVLFVVFAIHAMLGCSPALYSPVPSAEELERKAITYRLTNIKRGFVRLHVLNDKVSPRDKEYLYEIIFDEQSVRQVCQSRNRGKAEWGQPKKIITTPNQYIVDPENIKAPIAVRIGSAKDYKSPRAHYRVLNLQALGMDANGADGLHEAHVESLMNRSDRTIPVAHADVREGVETWRIEYSRKNQRGEKGMHISLWIAPSQGFSVIGIEVESDQGGKHYTIDISSQMKQYPTGGIWYPSKLIKTVKQDGRVFDRQVITIEEARFGGPIDDSAFTPAGLELKPGREVVDSTSGAPWLKVWDGNKLTDPSSVKTAPANPARHHQLLWILAVGLGLMAAVYFWRAFKKRKALSNPGT